MANENAHIDGHTDKFINYSKTCVKWPRQKDRKLVFKTNYRLIQLKSIAECSKENILQCFRTSLSYHYVIKIFVLSIFSGLLTGVLLN